MTSELEVPRSIHLSYRGNVLKIIRNYLVVNPNYGDTLPEKAKGASLYHGAIGLGMVAAIG